MPGERGFDLGNGVPANFPPGGEPPQAGQRPEETLKPQLAKVSDRSRQNASAVLALRRAGVTLYIFSQLGLPCFDGEHFIHFFLAEITRG